jgi:hypothetical protein
MVPTCTFTSEPFGIEIGIPLLTSMTLLGLSTKQSYGKATFLYHTRQVVKVRAGSTVQGYASLKPEPAGILLMVV